MKFSATLAAVAAPLAFAKAVRHNSPRAAAQVTAVEASPSDLAALGLSNGGSSGSAEEVIIIWVNNGAGAATQSVNAVKTVTETVTVAPTSAGGVAATSTVANGAGATHSVVVGGAAGLQFTPNSVDAAVGDMVVFSFESTNHTLTQSSFADPCVKMAGGMDSGFQPNVNNTVIPAPQVAMQVMVATPLWFYCAQKGHCGKGMTFSINPSAAKTQAMFQAAAIAQNGTGAASGITGGSSTSAAGSSATASATGESAPAASTSVAAPAPSASGSSGSSTGSTGSSNGVTTGTGTIGADGSCTCAVMCSSGSFPMAQAQGLANFGGVGGALPMANVVSR